MFGCCCKGIFQILFLTYPQIKIFDDLSDDIIIHTSSVFCVHYWIYLYSYNFPNQDLLTVQTSTDPMMGDVPKFGIACLPQRT